MKQIVGRVVTQAGRRGVPDLLITAFGSTPEERDVRIGAVFTDDEGRFDFAPVLAERAFDFQSIHLRVETPASQLSGSQIAPLAATLPRTNPGTVESFLIPVAEAALTTEGRDHFVPTGLPVGLSAPAALVTRAVQIAKHRDEIAASLKSVASERIDNARSEIDKVETLIRHALASVPEVVPTSPPDHLVFETSSVRDATFASMAATSTTLTGTKQIAKLSLTPDQLDTLRTASAKLR